MSRYIWATYLRLLSPFYVDDAKFYVSERRSEKLMKILLVWGAVW